MKRFLTTIVLAITLFGGALTAQAQGTKQTAQFNYVLRTMKLDKATKEKFSPVLQRYYEEIAAVKKEYSALKDKYRAADEAGKLTNEQCDLLFNSKNKQEMDELVVRKKYYEEFKKVLNTQQAYKAIRLANDKVK